MNYFSADEEVERVSLVSDGSGGQNRNGTMVGMVQYWLQFCSPSHRECVKLAYPAVGHPFPPYAFNLENANQEEDHPDDVEEKAFLVILSDAEDIDLRI
nr:unnamed protein product [Callosobruchus analis]